MADLVKGVVAMLVVGNKINNEYKYDGTYFLTLGSDLSSQSASTLNSINDCNYAELYVGLKDYDYGLFGKLYIMSFKKEGTDWIVVESNEKFCFIT